MRMYIFYVFTITIAQCLMFAHPSGLFSMPGVRLRLILTNLHQICHVILLYTTRLEHEHKYRLCEFVSYFHWLILIKWISQYKKRICFYVYVCTRAEMLCAAIARTAHDDLKNFVRVKSSATLPSCFFFILSYSQRNFLKNI